MRESNCRRNDANDLVTGPGNPHLIWDGAEARVITEDFYRALQRRVGMAADHDPE